MKLVSVLVILMRRFPFRTVGHQLKFELGRYEEFNSYF